MLLNLQLSLYHIFHETWTSIQKLEKVYQFQSSQQLQDIITFFKEHLLHQNRSSFI